VETGWDPERWAQMPKKGKREYKFFKPPKKRRVLTQGEFAEIEPPRIMKD
jgi:hypothetical protein